MSLRAILASEGLLAQLRQAAQTITVKMQVHPARGSRVANLEVILTSPIPPELALGWNNTPEVQSRAQAWAEAEFERIEGVLSRILKDRAPLGGFTRDWSPSKWPMSAHAMGDGSLRMDAGAHLRGAGDVNAARAQLEQELRKLGRVSISYL
jgi:hypothetical protein